MSRWSVVVPTNRPERFAEFIKAWAPLFRRHDVDVICVHDGETNEPILAAVPEYGGIEVWSWDRIPDWHPRGSDMIRSFGIHRAWQIDSYYTLSLDDDVRPSDVFDPFKEYEQVFNAGSVVSDYLSVGALTTSSLQMRGFPYRDRKPVEVAVQFGGWNGSLDYDAATQLSRQPHNKAHFQHLVMPVPRGVPVTGCIMNAAWRTKYAPIMWQLPLVEGRYNRFGDIWSALLAKRTLDELGLAMVINGRASVRHDRASDPLKNLERELPGILPNELIWNHVFYDAGGSSDVAGVYGDVAASAARYFDEFDRPYANHFTANLERWLDLFQHFD